MYYITMFDVSIFTFDGIGEMAAILDFLTPKHLAQPESLGILCVFTQNT